GDVPVELLADQREIDELEERRLQLMPGLLAVMMVERREMCLLLGGSHPVLSFDLGRPHVRRSAGASANCGRREPRWPGGSREGSVESATVGPAGNARIASLGVVPGRLYARELLTLEKGDVDRLRGPDQGSGKRRPTGDARC